ncbi:hypothetical protein EDC04DRAFT_2801646 [Pisolithus marmoratus]|nr:hypothetical protein EDC04DRAFT_2801646 [Pisolithus marmoratus]
MSLLASISLFALVVGRPILPGTELNVQSFPEPEAAQSTFQIGAGKDAYRSDAARVSSMTSDDGEQKEYLLQVIPSTGEPLVSFKGPSTLGGTQGGSHGSLYTALDKQILELDVARNNEELSDIVRAPINPSANVSRSAQFDSDQRQPSFSLLVLALSCVAAFLALSCIMLALYITKFLVSHMLASRKTWELLPHFQKSSAPIPQLEAKLNSCHSVEKSGLCDEGIAKYADTTSDVDSDGDDIEKYQDALDMTPIRPHLRSSPRHHSMEKSQPPPTFSSVQASPCDPDNSVTKEVSSMLSRPLWSVRASASPPLGLVPSRTAHGEAILPLVHGRRRAYRSAVPEFDIALALQLHPGLGFSADSAWVVRFLMTIFGWFAVALSTNR